MNITCNKPDCKTNGGSAWCNNCCQKRWRKRHPFKYHYKNLKNRARQLGREFDLTLEEFKKLWLEQPERWKDKRKNPKRTIWELDRKDGTKGYTYQNCHIITKKQNMDKYNNYNDNPEYPLEDKTPF